MNIYKKRKVEQGTRDAVTEEKEEKRCSSINFKKIRVEAV